MMSNSFACAPPARPPSLLLPTSIPHLARDPKLKGEMRLVLDRRDGRVALSSEETEHRGPLYATLDGAAVMPFHDEREALEWLRM